MSRVFRIESAGSVYQPMFKPQNKSLETSGEKILERARQDALNIQREAKIKAEKILDKARLRAIECQQKAETEGYSSGYKSGVDKGLANGHKLLEEAKNIFQNSKDIFSKRLEKSESQLLALVLEITQKLVGEALFQDPEVVISLLKKSIESSGGKDKVSVRVNPKLVAFVEGGRESLFRESGTKIVDVIGDQSVSSGAIIETQSGVIDATLETQIENLAKAIGEARNYHKGQAL